LRGPAAAPSAFAPAQASRPPAPHPRHAPALPDPTSHGLPPVHPPTPPPHVGTRCGVDPQYSDAHWAPHFVARWEPTPLTPAAHALAGSWRSLYASKAAADAEAAPWRRPCGFELQAALGEMVGGPAAGEGVRGRLIHLNGHSFMPGLPSYVKEGVHEGAPPACTEPRAGVNE
jgi:hypothetical protein